jgi:hypothetical protein
MANLHRATHATGSEDRVGDGRVKGCPVPETPTGPTQGLDRHLYLTDDRSLFHVYHEIKHEKR